MAKGDIELNLKTKYNGEGLQKLDNAVKNTSQKLKTVSGSVGGITRALDSLGQSAGGAGKAAGALTGILGGFAQGGIIGMGIAAVSWGIGKIGEQIEKAKERARELASSIKDGLVAAAETAAKKFDALKESITRSMQITGQKNAITDVKHDIRMQDELSEIAQRGRDERAGMTKGYDKAYSKAKEQHDSAVATGRRQLEQTADNEYRLMDVTKQKADVLKAARAKQKEARELANQSEEQIAEQIKRAGIERLRAKYGPSLAFSKAVGTYVEEGEFYKQAKDIKKKYKEQANSADEKAKKAQQEYTDAVNAEKKAHELTVLQEKKYVESVKKADEALKEAEQTRKDAIEAEKKASDAEAKRQKEKADAEKKAADAEAKRQKEKADVDAKAQKRKDINKEAKDERKRAEAEAEANDIRLKERKDAAARWEQQAQQARGVKFGDWMKDQRRQEKEKAKSDKQMGNVDREIAALEGRVLGRDGTVRRSASKADIARLEKLKQWKEFQDPNNNQAQKDAEKIEKEKIDLQKKTKQKIEDILSKLDDIAL